MSLYAAPRLLPAGDGGYVLEFGPDVDVEANRRARALAGRLAGQPGIEAAVASYRSVLVEFDPLRTSPEAVRARIEAALQGLEEVPDVGGREVEIPVCYGGEFGPDLAEVAARNGLREDEAVRLHAGGRYRAFCLGFNAGFAYLGGLHPKLHTPRLPTPRTSVPGGSVVIGGAQTAVHPFAAPTGWRVIGRTPLQVFRPEEDPPTLIQPGDTVRFRPISPAEFRRLASESQPTAAAGEDVGGDRPAALRVLAGGLLTTVQDLGRPGRQPLGISPGGAADPVSLRIANLLVGNAAGLAALECTLAGPELLFLRRTTIALAGADLGATLDGRPIPLYQSVPVRAGARLSFAPRSDGPHPRLTGGGEPPVGCRCYIAVAGGIDVPVVAGSRSTDSLAGFGGHRGRPLRAGDGLAVGPVGGDAWDLAGRALHRDLWPRLDGEEAVVSALAGPQDDRFTPEGMATFQAATYRVGHRSGRVALRLEGPPVRHRADADIVSDGIPPGAVQVPSDGQPIVVLSNRQTMGGYAKIACVARADLWRLGQRPPGSGLRFQLVDLAAARAALSAHAAWLREIDADLAVARRYRVKVAGQPFVVHLRDLP